MKIRNPIPPGTPVRVEQSIVKNDRRWTCTVEGVILEHRAQKTGSWFAHGKDDKLWLDRIRLQKADGEETLLTLDENTRITVLPPASKGS